jgi:phosphoribosylamine--glycine ligase
LRFLILSEAGDGVGLAYRLAAEGHSVGMWVRDDEVAHRGAGLVERSTFDKLGDSLDELTIIADCTGLGILCDMLRGAGYPVIGGSRLADKLEMDRAYAQDTMERAGIRTPKSRSFHDWEAAFDFVSKSESRLVFKPEGDLSGTVPSYVSAGSEDLLEVMGHAQAEHPKTKPEFTLQEFVEGTCVSTECWFDGNQVVEELTNHTIERKHLMNDDTGPSGGCTGNVVWRCGDCPICEQTVYKLLPFLQSHGYVGPIDVNAVVDKEGGVFGLEFTPRFGYDAFPTMLELLDGAAGDLLSGNGPVGLKSGFAAGVRLTLSPWPAEKHKGPEGLPIRGLNRSRLEHFYIYDCMEDVEGNLCTAGGYGIIGVANGYGETIEDAFAQAYRLVDKLEIPDKQFRTDLSETCQKDYRRLARAVRNSMEQLVST